MGSGDYFQEKPSAGMSEGLVLGGYAVQSLPWNFHDVTFPSLIVNVVTQFIGVLVPPKNKTWPVLVV